MNAFALRMRLSLLMIFSASLFIPVSGQEYFLYDSDCNASSENLHLTDVGAAILVVEESCPQQTFETVICTPQDDGSLEPALNLPFERPGPIFSTGDGFYMLSGNDDITYLRFISNNLEILSEVELSIPWYCKQLYVQGNYLITGYDGLGGVFNLVRLTVSNGQIEEEVAIPALTSAFPENTELIVENDETLYLGLDCSNRFEFDPLDLASAIVHPLPVNDISGEEYSPCAGFYDVFRAHPSPDTLWAASSSVLLSSEHYTFYFGPDGTYLGFDSYGPIDEDFIPLQYVYNDAGERFSSFVRPDYSQDSHDVVIYKIDAGNNVQDSVVYETPGLDEWPHQLMSSDNQLHLFGFEGIGPEIFTRKALYIRIDTDNLTNIQEPEQANYTFIQTEEAFGVRTNGTPLQQDIYSMTGQLLFSERRADLWSKSMLPLGTYVLKVSTDDRISSHLVLVR